MKRDLTKSSAIEAGVADGNPRRPAKSRRGSDTSDLIIRASIALFNRHGIQFVSIAQIAADRKMSPGNITYYFPLKSDLIHATLQHLKTRLREALEVATITTPREAGEFVLRGLKTLWEFRFFFNALTYLLGSDRELRKDYFQFTEWATSVVVEELERLVQSAQLQLPESPNSLRVLTDNMWAQWLNWLRMQQIENPRARFPRNDALYDCAFHLWGLCQPHLEPRFAKLLLSEIRGLLPAQ